MLIVRLQPPFILYHSKYINRLGKHGGGGRRKHVDTTGRTLLVAPTITASLFQLRIVFVSSPSQDFLATGLPSLALVDGDGLWLSRQVAANQAVRGGSGLGNTVLFEQRNDVPSRRL